MKKNLETLALMPPKSPSNLSSPLLGSALWMMWSGQLYRGPNSLDMRGAAMTLLPVGRRCCCTARSSLIRVDSGRLGKSLGESGCVSKGVLLHQCWTCSCQIAAPMGHGSSCVTMVALDSLRAHLHRTRTSTSYRNAHARLPNHSIEFRQ